ncbi:MAG: phosphate signaling complex protein PhoU [Immundisolibacter sp.]
MTLGKEDIGHHISQQYNQDLENLRSHVLHMGGVVERQIADAIAALEDGDAQLAVSVVGGDPQVNALEVNLDEECTRILARRQPAAGDLRLLLAVIKTVTDLERIGDQAERVARTVLELVNLESGRSRPPLRHMGELARRLLNKALDAFARMDVAAALEVEREDLAVDQEYEAVMRQLVTYMMEDPRTITWALNLVWAARALERIGDHSKNIAEYVIYLVQGKDVRHVSIEERERQVQGTDAGGLPTA